MENSFGSFLKQKRSERNLTQKELAKMLIISESVVSKWEKNVSYPDITMLPKLAEVLGVTEHELITASIDYQSGEEKIQAKKWRIFSMSWNLFFYISYGIAILTCFICNLSINKTLSWFWIVLSAIILAFSITNLPQFIKRYKLIFIPLTMFLSLCLLLAVCCIYTKGNWFWIVTVSVLLGLIVVFLPIYISKFNIFLKIKRFNDFISIGVDFILLNILLMVTDLYTVTQNHTTSNWYLKFALPIVTVIYLVLNLFLLVRFLKINKLLKTSIILFMINLFVYITPLFIKVDNFAVQKEIDSLNVFKANFSKWQGELSIERNIHCIIYLTLTTLVIVFLITGLIVSLKKRKTNK